MIVTSIEEALVEVRKRYPTATIQGSTFDWSFWVDGKVVAIAEDFRKCRKPKWNLKIYDTPQEV